MAGSEHRRLSRRAFLRHAALGAGAVSAAALVRMARVAQAPEASLARSVQGAPVAPPAAAGRRPRGFTSWGQVDVVFSELTLSYEAMPAVFTVSLPLLRRDLEDPIRTERGN